MSPAKPRRSPMAGVSERLGRAAEWIRWRSLSGQVFFVIAITFFSSCTLAGHLLSTRSLYADNLSLFSTYRDTWHAANYFGEFLLWHPYAAGGLGFPLYYFSLLGANCGTPLYAAVLDGLWVLGRLGIFVQNYTPFYIFYFSFLNDSQ